MIPAPTKLIILPLGDYTSEWREFINRVAPLDATPARGKDVYSPVFVYVRQEGGRLHLMLEIEDRTTSRDLREVSPLVLELRDRLMEFQGPRETG